MTLRAFFPALAAVAVVSGSLEAQNTHTLSGRVVEEGSSNGIPAASVEIENQEVFGTVSTRSDGRFQLEGLEPGGYTVRVLAIGYTPKSTYVVVEEDVALEIPMAVSPLLLDTLAVDGRSIEIEGSVLAEGKDLPIVNADVLTDRGIATRTDANGRFQLEGVAADIPVLIVVRSFGYLPLVATLVPEESETYEFELERDSLVQRAIAEQVARIEERADNYPSILRSVGSERLEQLAQLTLREALSVENSRRMLGRVRCWVVDGRQISAQAADVFLDTTVPQEIERIEFLSAPADPTFVMMRAYTNQFMRRMIASDTELRRPTFMQPSTGLVEIDQRRDYESLDPPNTRGVSGSRLENPPPPLCL